MSKPTVNWTRASCPTAMALVGAIVFVLALLASFAVEQSAAGFFDYWQKRPAYSGGYAQPGAFGRRR